MPRWPLHLVVWLTLLYEAAHRWKVSSAYSDTMSYVSWWSVFTSHRRHTSMPWLRPGRTDRTCSSWTSEKSKSKTRTKPPTRPNRDHTGLYSVSNTHTHTLPTFSWHSLASSYNKLSSEHDLTWVAVVAVSCSQLWSRCSSLSWRRLFVSPVQISMIGPHEYISASEWPLMVVRTQTQHNQSQTCLKDESGVIVWEQSDLRLPVCGFTDDWNRSQRAYTLHKELNVL